ncbi:MAG: EAL domain-containing protein [Gammaproteobacteria bacterium]|nr:EAL domain-containing protein [Gammaproteobacteria bacterium]
MMFTSINRFYILIVFLVSALLVSVNLLGNLKESQHADEAFKRLSYSISKVEAIVSSAKFNSTEDFKRFGERLDTFSYIANWKIENTQGKMILGSNFDITEKNAQYQFILNTPQEPYLLRTGFIVSHEMTSNFWWADFLVYAVFSILLVLAFRQNFKWIRNLEDHSKTLLTNNYEWVQVDDKEHFTAQAINKLIESNQALRKDNRHLTEQIKKTAYIDDNTGLGNKLFFKAEFQVRLHNREEPESGICMILSFVDYSYDNNFMLDEGRMLDIATVLRQFTGDIPNALIAKLQEKDFAILLPNQTRRHTDKLCKTLIEQLGKYVFDSTSVKEHFVDIGISAYRQGFDYYNIMAEADMALRNAQLQGSNSWFMYGEALDSSKVRGNLKWRSFLQNVLDKHQFQLFGQEVVYFNDIQIKHQEVFVRIEDDTDILTAETFLPMAYQCGLSAEFDRQVIEGVIKHCIAVQPVRGSELFSINVFISSLLDEAFVEWMTSFLSKHKTLCQFICFEISETMVNKHLVELQPVFQKIADLGVVWAIKKYGTPDIDLNYLDCLPINTVKIDRRIIRNIHKNKPQKLLLQTLLVNANSKHINVLVDGVEKEEDAIYIQNSGVQGAQGYYYATPKRLTGLEKYLKAV